MISLADQPEFGKLQNCRDEKAERFGVLGLGDQKERPQIDWQSLQNLRAAKPKKSEIQKRQGPEDAAVERVVGVITCPVVRLAVIEEFQRYRLQVFRRTFQMRHSLLKKVFQNANWKMQISNYKLQVQVTSYGLRVTCYKLQVTNLKLVPMLIDVFNKFMDSRSQFFVWLNQGIEMSYQILMSILHHIQVENSFIT